MTDQPKSTFARRIRAAKPRDKRYDIRDDVIPGLGLRIFPSGVRTFILSRMVRGRRRYATARPSPTAPWPRPRAPPLDAPLAACPGARAPRSR